ncbi:hypothetical protein FACS189459_6730 [Bacilli bacterium]|nr:hypothetical protein FACS189459_6730 [Bacilli bacterium]
MIYSSGRTTDELILQEFIAGDLYIINFFTFDGVPSFVDM